MRRRVVITAAGCVTALGVGLDATWAALMRGEVGVRPITAFDPAGFDCRIAGEAAPFELRDHLPRHYRKAAKVMARDTQLAVVAAAEAHGETPWTSERFGVNLGASLIAAELDELTAALAGSASPGGEGFDLRAWGEGGMERLPPLWLLKYLPNMLACHVSILHGARGPSNTITCGEVSGHLSVGEAFRTIRRGRAEVVLAGGAESKLNPTGLWRLQARGHLLAGRDAAIYPLDERAAGTAPGEAGGVVRLEWLTQNALDRKPLAEVVGAASAQSVHPASRNREPDPEGEALGRAIRAALRSAEVSPDEVDLLLPTGSGIPAYDRAEAAALRAVFGDRLASMAVLTPKASLGHTGAASGGLEIALAAKCLHEQRVPPQPHREEPLPGWPAGHPVPRDLPLRHAVIASLGFGGQAAAVVLRRG